MELTQIIILALVQGLTEYLPVSSSAHLILASPLFGFADQGLAFDVALHFGSLGAIVLYFRADIGRITLDWLRSLPKDGPRTANSWMAWCIILGTIPIVIAGLIFKALVENELRSPLVIAWATILFGLLLWWADFIGKRRRGLNDIHLKDAFIIGLMQCLAIIPGVSRSGITMTAGLMLGLSRQAAARFSFLLAIPTILMSSILVTWGLMRASEPVDWQPILWGVLLSFITAYACIHLFLRFIERIGMLPFAIYRLLLGSAILAILW